MLFYRSFRLHDLHSRGMLSHDTVQETQIAFVAVLYRKDSGIDENVVIRLVATNFVVTEVSDFRLLRPSWWI